MSKGPCLYTYLETKKKKHKVKPNFEILNYAVYISHEKPKITKI